MADHPITYNQKNNNSSTPKKIRNGNGEVTITDDGQFQAKSDYNPNWEKWDSEVYSFGGTTFGPDYSRVFNEFEGVVASDSHFFTRGGKGRWGFHVFEGYGKENDKRLTMLAGKFNGVANIYYYAPGQNFYWMQVGSDNKKRAFYFSQHKAEFWEDVEFMGDDIGLVLRSPNGSKFKLQVNDDGSLYTEPYTSTGLTTDNL